MLITLFFNMKLGQIRYIYKEVVLNIFFYLTTAVT